MEGEGQLIMLIQYMLWFYSIRDREGFCFVLSGLHVLVMIQDMWIAYDVYIVYVIISFVNS